jgi:hypothetical protein
MHSWAPLLEEMAWNHTSAAKIKRRKDHHEAWKAEGITKRDWNDGRMKQRRAGDEDIFSDDDDDDDDDIDVVVAAPRAGEATEGCSSSALGVPSRPTTIFSAAQGPLEACRGGDGPHDRASHPSSGGDHAGIALIRHRPIITAPSSAEPRPDTAIQIRRRVAATRHPPSRSHR